MGIRLNNVFKSFGNHHVLQGCTIEVKDGETLVIIGGSGTGKSVTLKIMIGLLKPDRGDVYVDDQEITDLDEGELSDVQRKFAYVFQMGALFDSLTVGENVAFGLRQLHQHDAAKTQGIVAKTLSLVGLSGIEHLKPAELSGGMRKRVAIARAVAMSPKYLFYDEPTTGLDPIMSDVINDLIVDLHNKLGTTGVVITHDMKSAYKIATRIAMLYEGKIVQIDTAENIQKSEDPIVKQFITRFLGTHPNEGASVLNMAVNGNNVDPEERFTPESKVGLFVLAGLAILMISILMLGDIHFKPQNHIHVIFKNVEGITDKSPVKIWGVEVGNVSKVELDGDRDDNAVITLALRKDVRLYKNSKVRIRSTGIIGSKFIAIDPGRPESQSSEESERLTNEATVIGVDQLSLDELMEQVAKSLDQFAGNGKMGDNLNATLANLRQITDSLNAAIGQQRRSLVNIVQNVEGFSQYAKSVAAHLDEIMTGSRQEIKEAIHNLKETLEKSNAILAQVQKGDGAVGSLLYDKHVGDEVKQTVTNLKQTSESAKDVMARFTKVRAFWIVQGRRDVKAGVYRGDVGLRLEPRPNKYYEVLGQNLSTKGSSATNSKDFERPNTITALMGRNWGSFTGAVGVIKSRAGVEGHYRPFQNTETPVLNRLELVAQGFDFGRDAIINGRHFKNPDYMAGARVKVNNWVTAGVQAEDIAETTDWHGLVNVSFEDKDIAYILGFVSFAR